LHPPPPPLAHHHHHSCPTSFSFATHPFLIFISLFEFAWHIATKFTPIFLVLQKTFATRSLTGNELIPIALLVCTDIHSNYSPQIASFTPSMNNASLPSNSAISDCCPSQQQQMRSSDGTSPTQHKQAELTLWDTSDEWSISSDALENTPKTLQLALNEQLSVQSVETNSFHSTTSVDDTSCRKRKRRISKPACLFCHKSRKACSDHRPCDRCTSRGIQCEEQPLPSQTAKRKRKKDDFQINNDNVMMMTMNLELVPSPQSSQTNCVTSIEMGGNPQQGKLTHRKSSSQPQRKGSDFERPSSQQPTPLFVVPQNLPNHSPNLQLRDQPQADYNCPSPNTSSLSSCDQDQCSFDKPFQQDSFSGFLPPQQQAQQPLPTVSGQFISSQISTWTPDLQQQQFFLQQSHFCNSTSQNPQLQQALWNDSRYLPSNPFMHNGGVSLSGGITGSMNVNANPLYLNTAASNNFNIASTPTLFNPRPMVREANRNIMDDTEVLDFFASNVKPVNIISLSGMRMCVHPESLLHGVRFPSGSFFCNQSFADLVDVDIHLLTSPHFRHKNIGPHKWLVDVCKNRNALRNFECILKSKIKHARYKLMLQRRDGTEIFVDTHLYVYDHFVAHVMEPCDTYDHIFAVDGIVEGEIDQYSSWKQVVEVLTTNPECVCDMQTMKERFASIG